MDALTNRRVVVMGQGYVGLTLAMRAVEVGHEVVGFDTDPARVQALRAAESHVEDVAPATIARAISTGRYIPSATDDDLKGFEVAIIAVPTPLRDGNPDLFCVKSASVSLSRHLTKGSLVVLESTTYPGTTTELVGPLLEAGSGLIAGADFHLGFSPERIDPGNPTWRLDNTPKIVSGINSSSLTAVREFYDTLVAETVPVSGPAEAELAKLLENTFRHVNVALVNELAMFAADLGVDIWQAIEAASTKPFGFMAFTPGPGVGGHCLPIDPSYLSWRVKRQLGRSFRFVELANDVNNHMPRYVVDRLTAALNRQFQSVNASRVLLLGLAYKRNTSDARESPALAVAQRLIELGAQVRAADPYVSSHVDRRVVRVDASATEAAAADAVVLLTDHDAFDLPTLVRRSRYFLDTRHRAIGANVEDL